MNVSTEIAGLIAERDEIDLMIGRALDQATKRSLVARKASLTRKINKAQTQPLQPAPQPSNVATLTDPPMPPQQILAEARRMLADHGLTGWRVKLSNIMTKTYGICDHGKRELRIAGRIAAINPAAETRNTIAHEVAHAIVGHGAGHGPAWKRACRETGARPVRCHQANTVPTAHRFRGICEACGEDVAGRKFPPQPGATHFHLPSVCPSPKEGFIRWVEVKG